MVRIFDNIVYHGGNNTRRPGSTFKLNLLSQIVMLRSGQLHTESAVHCTKLRGETFLRIIPISTELYHILSIDSKQFILMIMDALQYLVPKNYSLSGENFFNILKSIL